MPIQNKTKVLPHYQTVLFKSIRFKWRDRKTYFKEYREENRLRTCVSVKCVILPILEPIFLLFYICFGFLFCQVLTFWDIPRSEWPEFQISGRSELTKRTGWPFKLS